MPPPPLVNSYPNGQPATYVDLNRPSAAEMSSELSRYADIFIGEHKKFNSFKYTEKYFCVYEKKHLLFLILFLEKV